jgi:FMN phosphatase YigB (HAD superfamily)
MRSLRPVTMPLKLLYFDLGQVLVRFDMGQMLRQVAEAADIDTALAERALFAEGLQIDYELGRITSRDFYDAFCRATASRPDYDRLAHAASAFFTINHSILPVVAQLRRAGYRLGVLSNTCELHWEYCLRQFRFVAELFDVHALSFRLGAMKPDAAIYRGAAELADCRPEHIFFVDDMAVNVEGALAAGFDAVQYTDTRSLVADLRRRGVTFNY